jgi:hypothetical protein
LEKAIVGLALNLNQIRDTHSRSNLGEVLTFGRLACAPSRPTGYYLKRICRHQIYLEAISRQQSAISLYKPDERFVSATSPINLLMADG